MQALFQTFFSTIFEPSSLRERAHRHYWWHAAVLILLITSLQTFSLAGKHHFSVAQTGLALALFSGSSLLIWWIATLLLHFTADLLGGQGRFADTMAGIGLATLPFVLSSPLNALPNMLGRMGHTLALVGYMALILWGIILCVLGLSAAQHFSSDRAMGALVLGCVFAFALFFGGTLLGGLQIFFWLAQSLT